MLLPAAEKSLLQAMEECRQIMMRVCKIACSPFTGVLPITDETKHRVNQDETLSQQMKQSRKMQEQPIIVETPLHPDLERKRGVKPEQIIRVQQVRVLASRVMETSNRATEKLSVNRTTYHHCLSLNHRIPVHLRSCRELRFCRDTRRYQRW